MTPSARINEIYARLHQWRIRLVLSASALLLVAVFVVAIHPETGILGGLGFLLAGWAIPSVLNLLVTTLLVSFLPRPLGSYPLALLALSLVISFGLAAGVETPIIVQRLLHPPNIEASVIRRIFINRGNISFTSSPLFVVANPLAQVIQMSGNEGCGCSYWEVQDVDPGMLPVAYSWLLSEDLNRVTGGSGVMWSAGAERSVLVSGHPSSGDPNLVDIAIEIKEGDSTTASFHEYAVPRYSDAFIDSNRAPLLNGYFAAIVSHDLTHGTFWSPLIGVSLGYYPRARIERFLREAIDVQ